MQISKKLVFLSILTVLALPLAGAVSTASAQNLLTNPGFESGDLTGWTVAGGNASATVTIQTPDNGPSLPGMYNAFMNNQGEAIGLTLKQTTADGSATGGTVYYAYDLKLDQADVGIIGGSGLMGPLWPWEWTHYEGEFAAPAGTTFLTIQIMANTGAAIGTNCVAHADNVYLSQDGGVVATESSNWDNVKALYR